MTILYRYAVEKATFVTNKQAQVKRNRERKRGEERESTNLI